MQDQFASLAVDRIDVLRDVLHNGAEPEERAVAAAIIGYAPKKDQVIKDLQYAMQDAEPAVRANAVRAMMAIAVLAQKRPELGLRIESTWMVEMLNSIVLGDRQQAALALVTLTEQRNAATLDLIRTRALPALVEMARWKTLRYALPAFLLVGRTAGIPEQELMDQWQKGDRETAIKKASAAAESAQREVAYNSRGGEEPGPGRRMAITRREILAGMAAVATAAAQQKPHACRRRHRTALRHAGRPRVPRPRTPPKPRTSPAVCLYSQHLIKVEYEAVGMVLRDLGFDGCDLAVVPGSHIAPEQAGSDLMRGIEAISGVGLEVPIISTSVISGNDPNGRQILGIAGFMGVGLFRPGYWKYGNAPDLEARLAEVQREVFGLASIARAYNVGDGGTQRDRGFGGRRGLGYERDAAGHRSALGGLRFRPGYATENAGASGAAVVMRLAMPKLKAVTVRDFTWNKDAAGAWKATPCPLGEGMVDWRQFFTALARVRFVGPITIEARYETKDELNAFRHDLEFVRKQIAAAYGAAPVAVKEQPARGRLGASGPLYTMGAGSSGAGAGSG